MSDELPDGWKPLSNLKFKPPKRGDGTEPAKRPVMALFLSAPDEHSPDCEWDLVEPADVPEDVSAPDVLGVLLGDRDNPLTARSPTTGLFYRAIDAEEIKALAAELMPEGEDDEPA